MNSRAIFEWIKYSVRWEFSFEALVVGVRLITGGCDVISGTISLTAASVSSDSSSLMLSSSSSASCDSTCALGAFPDLWTSKKTTQSPYQSQGWQGRELAWVTYYLGLCWAVKVRLGGTGKNIHIQLLLFVIQLLKVGKMSLKVNMVAQSLAALFYYWFNYKHKRPQTCNCAGFEPWKVRQVARNFLLVLLW
mgnify:CR=1 FL=1